MIVHGFIVVALARLVRCIILFFKQSRFMRTIKKTVKKIARKGVVEFLSEVIYHSTAITMMVIVSLVQPGQPI
jgi:hypothetical protein